MAYPRENFRIANEQGAGIATEVKAESAKAGTDHRIHVMKIVASLSYVASAVSALCTVEDGTTTWGFYVASASCVVIEPEWQGAAGAKVTVKLAAATGATGTIALFYAYE